MLLKKGFLEDDKLNTLEKGFNLTFKLSSRVQNLDCIIYSVRMLIESIYKTLYMVRSKINFRTRTIQDMYKI